VSADGEGGTPSEVERLIALVLSSMLHVELLLLLHRTAPAPWDVARAATELKVSPTLVEPAIHDLQRARLAVEVAGTSPQSWRFDPSDDRLLAATAALRELYDRKPVTLVKALYRRPPSAADAFADAFRLRPKGDE